MNISIASGKGGTGKTFLTVNLARILQGKGVRVLDCDVEEPDDHLFLKPENQEKMPVSLPVPQVDLEKCSHCGKCAQVCAYHAIVDVGNTVLVFPEMCHGCGGCALICPEGAITEKEHPIGKIEKGKSGEIELITGILDIKEVASSHLIRHVKKFMKPDRINLVDASPGTTCPTVTAISGTDYCILVTEPTPFGMNDLALAVEMTRQMNIPSGVVINRHGIGDDRVEKYCREQNIPVLAKIPHDREIAKIYARGELAVEKSSTLKELLKSLFERLQEEVRAG